MSTDAVEQFGDADNTDFETVFVLTDFDSPQYHYLYKRDNRIMGPPVVLQCATKEEVSGYKQTPHTVINKKCYTRQSFLCSQNVC